MKSFKILPGIIILLAAVFILTGCRTENLADISETGRPPEIFPDYSGVTIPPNIAPMNFAIREIGKSYKIIIKSLNTGSTYIISSKGIVSFHKRLWKKLIKESIGGMIEFEIVIKNKKGLEKKFNPIYMNVANEPADPYLCYRILYPGYESWSDMKIIQRSIGNFNETSLFENQLLKDNCVNCHSFVQNDPSKFLLHVRGDLRGTYFANGKDITRVELNNPQMPGNAVIPSWHPSGKYIVFSSNKMVQSFHMGPEKNTEVYDLSSMLVLYNPEKNEISRCGENDSIKYMETFPCWSPSGDCLYYCRTDQVNEIFDFRKIKYDLVKRSFSQDSESFGKTTVVFNASEMDKSVSIPSISPDGRYLVFTLHDYGTFSIWHREADLYLLDLESGRVSKMDINSNETESHHSWSSNGKWLVFSSKRDDGLSSRPYFAYFGSPDSIGKPFVLPQKDPFLYKNMEEAINRPEFVTGKIEARPHDFEKASENKSRQAKWIERN